MEGFLDKELADYLVDRIMQYEGNFDVMETAIGVLFVGQLTGWRVLSLLHSSRSIRKYQDVVGLDFKGTLPWAPDRPVMPETGPFAGKSLAFRVAERLGDFWKVVRGQSDEIKSSSERKKALPFSD